MLTFERVGHNFKNELIDLLEICFKMGDKANYMFFEYVIQRCVCLAAMKDKKVVAALYLLDSNIIQKGELIPAYYVYAVGTYPNFRRQGIMKQLLDYASDFALQQKRKYTFLLPSDDKKYLYYEKCGYKRFFNIRRVNISKSQIDKLFSDSPELIKGVRLSSKKMAGIRLKQFCSDGDVIWDKHHIKFLKKFSKVCEMELIYASNGYALCVECERFIEVKEIVVYNNDYSEIIRKILKRYGFENYRFILSLDSTLFKGLGDNFCHGMIHCTSKENKILGTGSSYLGLALD